MNIPYKHEITVESSRAFMNFVDDVTNLVKEVIKDKNHSLDKRWQIYQTSLKLFPTKSYYWTPPSLHKAGFNDSWYDDFYLEKMETLYFDDEFIDRIKEKYPKCIIEELKQEILESGIGGFVYDW